MALKSISKCLESNSRINTDVEFVFYHDQKTVSAHRVILSVASDVFEAQFYGGVQDFTTQVLVTDASHTAFQLMVEYIYNKKHNWDQEKVGLLCEMYYLGEKYHLDDLKRRIMDAVTDHEVSNDNFLEVAKTAEKQAHHPELSSKLYNISAMFLKNKFEGDVNKVVKLFSEIEADPTDATNSFVLHKLMKTLNELKFTCLNNNLYCLCSKEPSKENFLVGARIRIVKGKHFNKGINPYATLERFSKTRPAVFIAKKATGYISCYFGRGAYFYECSEHDIVTIT